MYSEIKHKFQKNQFNHIFEFDGKFQYTLYCYENVTKLIANHRNPLWLKTVIIYAKQNYSYFSKIYGKKNLLEFWYSCLSLITLKTKQSKQLCA